MSGATRDKNVYEDFEPRTDTLFFKVDSSHGLVSFHGRNYNIKKRLSADERNRLMSDAAFFRLDSNCYVNAGKISRMEDDAICFGDTNKRIPCSKRKQQMILNLLSSSARISGS
ncbi:LytTR family transcriptional regulator DNA-binding domain-containing protein [Cohnella sp. CFH 77786]|uniref:LytTR family transcriptional regulator DNA-binding domain-containing protein n=1 Tax=Cohnella sp. CFH 77786 TaxID=2662265 RepID=UPI0021021D4E|nr:LytTR family transcriptional regulator DNA-binding domain-containing protein [Cohnella sp. CFH 77786]